MTFRFQAKYALLTYAQCGDLCGFSVTEHLGNLGAECGVFEEDHADGGRHLHVFARWERQFHSRRSDVFDVGGRHPNIIGNVRDPRSAFEYCAKEGVMVAGSITEPPGRNTSSGSSDKWADIVAASTEDEFWCRVRELDPKALCTSYPSLRKYADFAYAPIIREYESPPGLEFTSGAISRLGEWARTSLGTGGGECWRSHAGGCRVRSAASCLRSSTSQGVNIVWVDMLTCFIRRETYGTCIVWTQQMRKNNVGKIIGDPHLYGRPRFGG